MGLRYANILLKAIMEIPRFAYTTPTESTCLSPLCEIFAW